MSNRKLTERQREAIIWIEALRSGKYKQTAGTTRQLMRNGGFRVCAVGAYYEVIGLSGTLDWISEQYARAVFGNELITEVVVRNDHRGMSFPEIADYIEQEMFANVDANV